MFFNFGFEQWEKELKLKKIENTNFKLYMYIYFLRITRQNFRATLKEKKRPNPGNFR